ncbi:potassium channel family protein [Hoyosella rhizosphaerae]|nr:potassium channel family protein [Hoyosella rhizosphaerae]
MPKLDRSPAQAIATRIVGAVVALFVTSAVVYIDRDGYSNSVDSPLSYLDCLYYATVSLSTTGYGDIAPLTPFARATNIFLITPLRVMFFILLIGTTLEVLTETSRQAWRIQRWRERVRNHTIVVGYGTKGRTAVDAMLGDGARASDIVVVDTEQATLDVASARGLVTVKGSATRSDVLRLAGAAHAAAIIVATDRDDSAILTTLTARELAPRAKIIASIRESENMHLLKQSGADSVVVSSETAGRLLGIATTAPNVVEMFEDLLTPEVGFAIAERRINDDEIGRSPRQLPDISLGVVRMGTLYRADDSTVARLQERDRILYLRRTPESEARNGADRARPGRT